ncbi:winged helix-turn-helix transcriptional regulator [candidate division KSB1 bacterium]
MTKPFPLTLYTFTEYFISSKNNKPYITLGRKPKGLPSHRRVCAKDIRSLQLRQSRGFILDEARKYLRHLHEDPALTRSELAERQGISRARVTQMMNILNLPNEILSTIECFKNNNNMRSFWTERRLRPLTQIQDVENCLEKFHQLSEGVIQKY